MKDLKPFIASTAVAVVLAGGALASATVGLFGPAEDAAVEMVPSNAFLYGNVFLDPSAPQKLALQDLMAKFPNGSNPDEAADAIARLLDKGLNEMGLSFATDVEPWLGSQIAFFVSPPTGTQAPSGAVLIASDDPGATEATLNKAIASGSPASPAVYSGVEYSVSSDGGAAAAVIEDFLVIGDEKGLRAVIDATDADSLGDSDAYATAVDGLTEDRLATLYADPAKILAGLPPGVGMPGMGQTGPSVSILYARSDALVFESSSAAGPAGALFSPDATELLDNLPGDAWAAAGAPQVGRTISQMLSQMGGMGAMVGGQLEVASGLRLEEDLLSWIGDIALFAQGNSVEAIQGGLVIQATDPKAAAAALPKIKSALKRAGVPLAPLDLGGFDGFAIDPPGMRDNVFVAAADQRVLVIYGYNATLAALGSDPALGGDEDFLAAEASLGDGFSVAAYLELPQVVGLLDKMAAGEADWSTFKGYLEPLTSVVVGSKNEGGQVITRIVIGAR